MCTHFHDAADLVAIGMQAMCYFILIVLQKFNLLFFSSTIQILSEIKSLGHEYIHILTKSIKLKYFNQHN